MLLLLPSLSLSYSIHSEERQKCLRLANDVLSNRQFVVAKARPIMPKMKKKRRDEKGEEKGQGSSNYLRSVRMSQSATTANRVSSALRELQVPDAPLSTARVSKGESFSLSLSLSPPPPPCLLLTSLHSLLLPFTSPRFLSPLLISLFPFHVIPIRHTRFLARFPLFFC